MELLDQLPAGLLPNLGAGSLLALFVLAVLRGWLVPRKSVDQMLAVKEERIVQAEKRGDEWKAAYEAATARADQLADQNDQLQEVGKTTAAILDSMRSASAAASAAARPGRRTA